MRQLAKALGVLCLLPALGACTDEPEVASQVGSQTLEGALLPDLVVRQSDLYDHAVDYGNPLQPQLRLSNGTANVGDGKLHLFGVTPGNGDGTQDVMQRVYGSNGYEDRVAGKFIFHPGHSHIHFEGWAAYRLREILPGDGVGNVVAEGAKTSFCIIDLGIHDSTLPNFDPDGEFKSCSSTVQGLAVGWIDVYSKGLPGQSIDITGVAPSQYWLESEVDPLDLVLEKDENNNVARVKVTIGAAADPYEPNDTTAQVDSRPVGGPNSPNLGPVGPTRTIEGLSLEDESDVDWFRFYLNDTGTALQYVRIAFDPNDGDGDLALHDDAGNLIAESAQAGTPDEELSLVGLPEGYYRVKVSGHQGSMLGSYALTLVPTQNQAPTVTVTDPGTEQVDLIHSIETHTIAFTASDPDGDDTWVSVYVNSSPVLDGNQELLPTSLHTPSSQGFYIFNSADVDPGIYWIYAEVTDGGTVTGSWSQAPINFYVDPNCAHPLCETGVALTASCDPCAAAICEVDPYCCNNGWDSICEGEVASVCGGGCSEETGCADHLLINEVRCRGAGGGSDEFVELYNPTGLSVSPEGVTLENRKHNGSGYNLKWTGDVGAWVPPGGHYLMHGNGFTAASNDKLSSGFTDAGSLVLRNAEDEVVDAVCFAYSSYTTDALSGPGFVCEGTPVDNAPHANTTAGNSNSDVSFERLTCGDSDDNATDFATAVPSTPTAVSLPQP